MSLTALTSSLATYTAAIKSFIQSRVGATAVAQSETIPADGVVTYDLAALLGVDHTQYDKLSANIVVKVLDTDPVSPTVNMYINSEAVITVGVTAAGSVTVHNYHTASLDCYVRIDVPLTTATTGG